MATTKDEAATIGRPFKRKRPEGTSAELKLAEPGTPIEEPTPSVATTSDEFLLLLAKTEVQDVDTGRAG